ncbi:hypothetical protein [Macrococcoides bohemicum]|uniref:hypothetical protein n=1 Tax=Macrococcoides bohemicum TaxID=1903056 RepID=UPI0019400BF9|nr:hypothetical protein [Macrococcus bohemicus]QRN48664.1 hypothetical protein HT586_00445 [Macrococcus bohemicus]
MNNRFSKLTEVVGNNGKKAATVTGRTALKATKFAGNKALSTAKTTGKYAGMTAVALVEAIWETTGSNGTMRTLMEDLSDKELMEWHKHNEESGDYDTNIGTATKSLLESRGYKYDYNNKVWNK